MSVIDIHILDLEPAIKVNVSIFVEPQVKKIKGRCQGMSGTDVGDKEGVGKDEAEVQVHRRTYLLITRYCMLYIFKDISTMFYMFCQCHSGRPSVSSKSREAADAAQSECAAS